MVIRGVYADAAGVVDKLALRDIHHLNGHDLDSGGGYLRISVRGENRLGVAAIDRFAKTGAIVTDVGSTKREIVRAANRVRFKRIRFIGSHPLAGSHERGIEHASEKLFDHALVFLTPTLHSNPNALGRVTSLWKKLKAINNNR